jgi:diacylglycerol kinase family enzyme
MHDVIVANGRWHAGGMKLAPDASADDGLFDVVLIGDVSKLDFVTTSPKLYSGGHVAHPRVEVVRTAAVGIAAERPLPIEVEGEPVGTTPARFEIVPGALRVRVPR